MHSKKFAITFILIFKIIEKINCVDHRNTKLYHEKIKLILDAHNAIRKKHRAGPLRIDITMNNYAEQWAIYNEYTDTLATRPQCLYGQNLWIKSGVSFKNLMNSSDTNPVQEWYDEVKLYPGNFQRGSSYKSASFTQLVWRNSYRIGIAIGEKENNETLFVICYYYPRGNELPGEHHFTTHAKFHDNVSPSTGKYRNFKSIPYLDIFIILVSSLLALIIKIKYRNKPETTDRNNEQESNEQLSTVSSLTTDESRPEMESAGKKYRKKIIK